MPSAGLFRILPLLACMALAAPVFAQDDTQTDPPTQTLPADPTLVGQTREWQVCNETSFAVRTASAFLRGARMAAKGWDEILPGACLSQTTPASGPRFLFAESLDIHRGGVREWKGTTSLCVEDDADFTSDATEDCRLANRERRDYFAVRPGEPVTKLVEPADFGPEKAIVAAQQRLLRDAGYDITRIDGLTGRKTSRLLRRFRSDAGLAATVTGEALLRALMEAAASAHDMIGLNVCNDGAEIVWAAIATRDDGQWRSRGWWQVAPDQCVRPINVALPGTEAHLFAVQADGDNPDKRLIAKTTVPAQFCIAESKFDALGNALCLEKGYTVANFRPIATQEAGATVRLTDADFAAPLPGGLRR